MNNLICDPKYTVATARDRQTGRHTGRQTDGSFVNSNAATPHSDGVHVGYVLPTIEHVLHLLTLACTTGHVLPTLEHVLVVP